MEGQLPVDHIFGFCRLFKKIIKQIGFHLTVNKADLEVIIYITFANDFSIKIDEFFYMSQ